jgi:REP element-mobilizing transposase RayT
MPRVKVGREAYYHVTSRCALQEFLMGPADKDMFVKMMRRAERFSGVHIVTYCVMDNHFHILVKIPKSRDISEATLKERISILYGEEKAERIFEKWKAFANAGDNESVQREQDAFRKRMYDLSEFGKTLEQRYSVWYCQNHKRRVGNGAQTEIRRPEGTIWQGRFHSVLVESTQKALTAVAAYIDMNPVRAKIVSNAKVYRWSGYGAAKHGDGDAAKARTLVDSVIYDSILEEKTHGFAEMVPSVSRGVAIGSEKFVITTIEDCRGEVNNRTMTTPLAKKGSLALLCSAVRRRKTATA